MAGQARAANSRRGAERRGVEMHAASGSCGMDDQTGCGLGVIRGLSAVERGDAGVGLASGNHIDAVRLERGAEARGESEGDVLLLQIGPEVGAGIAAAVSGIEDDDKLGLGWLHGRGWHGRRGRRLTSRSWSMVTGFMRKATFASRRATWDAASPASRR